MHEFLCNEYEDIKMENHGVTREAAEFVAALQFADLPSECVHIAKRCIIDGIGVMLAGSNEPCAIICRQYALSVSGKARASFFGKDSQKAPAHLAALVNGTAGHALDWDDTALSNAPDRSVLIHPTMQPLAAGLALAEVMDRSGEELLTAFIAGFEVQCKIAESIDPSHFSGGRGFHTSNTIGIFGAAVTASKLLGLDREKTLNALGIAVSMSSGVGVNHGTMGKPLQMGRAAENGIVAAQLAAIGMDAHPEALEGPRGFFQCFGGGYEPKNINGKFGTPFSIIDPGVSIKPYPCGVVGHPGMDAMRDLATEYDVASNEVKKVRVFTGSNVLPPGPLRYQIAQSALEGKFCVPFQIASMIIRRKAGMMEFSDSFVRSPDAQAMMQRIKTKVAPEIDALGKSRIVFKIELELKDGRILKQESDKFYRGGPKNPLSREDLMEKFADASQNCLSTSDAHVTFELIERIDKSENIKALLNMVAR